MLTQVVQTPEQQKWLSKLLGFDYTIMYRPGKAKQTKLLMCSLEAFIPLSSSFQLCLHLHLVFSVNYASFLLHRRDCNWCQKFSNRVIPQTTFCFVLGYCFTRTVYSYLTLRICTKSYSLNTILQPLEVSQVANPLLDALLLLFIGQRCTLQLRNLCPLVILVNKLNIPLRNPLVL